MVVELSTPRGTARYLRFRKARRFWIGGRVKLAADSRRILEAMYAAEPQLGTDGGLHSIDKVTRISWDEGLFLKSLHERLRPELSIEVGLAYGFSTVYMLSAMKDGCYGSHIAIDPWQSKNWHGIGLNKAVEMGMSDRFTLIEKDSANALAELREQGKRAQFFFIDGGHRFDNVILDFLLADKICDVNGYILFDDLWMPAIKKVCNFIEKNRKDYVPIGTPVRNLWGYQKIANDCRNWRHFVNF